MRKYKSRLEKWKEPIRVPCAYNTIDDIEFSDFLKNRSQINSEDRKITYDEMIGASKELIFDIRDGKPVFICINITLDTYKFDLVISEGWQTVPDEMNREEIDEHVVSTLARASMQSVPVYPNTEECEPILAQYYEELVINGFLADNSDGTKVRLINTDSPKEKIKDIKYLLNRDVSIDINPAELAIIKKVAKETFSKLSQAEKVLLNLTQGINEFSEILNDTERNEREIQICLKNNPILFGLEYISVIPEHRLGSEYIIDFGLEKYSGNFDVVGLCCMNLL